MNNVLSNINHYLNQRSETKKIETENFRAKYSFEKRFEEATRILGKYPERVPIICERITTNIPEIDRKKYLCPRDLSIANFMYVIRKRLKLSSEKSIYLFINNKIMPSTSSLLGVIYENYKDKDGFLYISYGGESTFG
jgi:GABA(A) receptor-associated protein